MQILLLTILIILPLISFTLANYLMTWKEPKIEFKETKKTIFLLKTTTSIILLLYLINIYQNSLKILLAILAAIIILFVLLKYSLKKSKTTQKKIEKYVSLKNLFLMGILNFITLITLNLLGLGLLLTYVFLEGLNQETKKTVFKKNIVLLTTSILSLIFIII